MQLRAVSQRFLAVSVLALAGFRTTAVYNSEEHKLVADLGAGRVNQRSAVLPSGTRFQDYEEPSALGMYQLAKELAVGFQTNNPNDYDVFKPKVQDNSYLSIGQLAGNKNIHIPFGEVSRRHLIVPAFLGAATEFTFGELVALYGDYRKTVHCVEGRCYLTNRDNTEYVGVPPPATGPRASHTTYFEYGVECNGVGHCGLRPDPVPTWYYLRSIGSGLWPPFGSLANEVANTAGELEELDAGWWGDEMVRLANINDWHFSSAAVAWYIGMHRLALRYVDQARTDPRYWNHALHYEANALHSLTDLFAFGHVVTNRDRTSYGIIADAGVPDRPYLWMDNVLYMGGGSRTRHYLDGKLQLTTTLPPIADRVTLRNDFIASYRGTWFARAIKEHDHHKNFNASGATVMNLKRQEFTIYGDARLRDTPADARAVLIETVRASVQSLFDAYESGGSIDEIGAVGSRYFDALLNIPIFVKQHPEHVFDGRWTPFARALDVITNAGVVPADQHGCVMEYIDGDVDVPAPRAACTAPTAPSQADVVAELVSRNGALGRGDQLGFDAAGNVNGSYDVGDFLAWVRANNAHPSHKGGRP